MVEFLRNVSLYGCGFGCDQQLVTRHRFNWRYINFIPFLEPSKNNKIVRLWSVSVYAEHPDQFLVHSIEIYPGSRCPPPASIHSLLVAVFIRILRLTVGELTTTLSYSELNHICNIS